MNRSSSSESTSLGVGGSPGGNGAGSPSRSIPSRRSASTCSRRMSSRSSRERSQPSEKPRLRGRPVDPDRPDVGDPGPERGEERPPPRRPLPGDVGGRRAREELGEARVRVRQVVPLGRVDDEPVGDADELVELRRAPRRLAAPAQEDGQVGDEQRLDDARRRLRARPVQMQLHHLGAHVALDVGHREGQQRHLRVDPVEARVRLRDDQDGPRRVPLRHPGERGPRPLEPRLRHPGEMRHHARAEVRRRHPAGDDSARSRPSAASTSASRTPSPFQLSVSTGRAQLSSSATSGRRGGAGRRRSAGPSCRRRSSGSRAGRAATSRSSRRRAATAPRPRRRA